MLSPVRDVAGWFSDTFRAKSQVAALRAENQRLTDALDAAQQKAIDYRQVANEVGLDTSIGLSSAQRVNANVISQDPQLWYATIEIDKGSDDGVAMNAPVVGDGALVGKVTTVDPTVSWVTLITDHSFAASAEIQDAHGDRGVLAPQVGQPNAMLLQDLDRTQTIQNGQQVVTTGFDNGDLRSLYPAGIPIGQVTNFNSDQLLNDGEVEVTPKADLRHLSVVQVLVHVDGGTQLASVTNPGGSTGTSAGAGG